MFIIPVAAHHSGVWPPNSLALGTSLLPTTEVPRNSSTAFVGRGAQSLHPSTRLGDRPGPLQPSYSPHVAHVKGRHHSDIPKFSALPGKGHT